MDNNGFQQYQGFGVQPQQQQPDQWEVAARLAAMPDTGLTNRYMNAEMPQGEMVSGHYVAPSWTQHLDAGLRRVAGQQMYNEGTAARQALVNFLRDRNRNLGADTMSQLTGEGGVPVTAENYTG
jgi:hypothetical protein